MATMGTEKSGHCREATVLERFEQESMNGLSTQKSGCCGDKYRLIVFIQSVPFIVDTQDHELVTSVVKLSNGRSKIQFAGF